MTNAQSEFIFSMNLNLLEEHRSGHWWNLSKYVYMSTALLYIFKVHTF